jgi:hypothetical protein
MSFSTYSELKSAIADWLNRTDLTNQIPDFITLAENRISHELRIPAIEKSIILNVASGYATLPSDFLEAKDVFCNYDPLTRVSLSEIHRLESRSGTPELFARETYRLMFYPTPVGDDDEIRMIYYYDVGRLSDSQTSHVLLDLAPELYLYGALVEATDYLGGDQLGAYEAKFQAAMSRLVKHSRDSEVAGATPIVSSGY